MILGVTGTRYGLSRGQSEALAAWLYDHGPGASELHHGCARGADSAIALAARGLLPGLWIVAHPGDDPRWTCEAAKRASSLVLPEKANLERNADIVQACSVLAACPRTDYEERRSGTWATVRRARRAGRRLVVFCPDGRVEEE